MTGRDTNLRDARLHKALAHAPDGDGLPAPSTRNDIKNIANNVIRTRAEAIFLSQNEKMPWWKALWERSRRVAHGEAGSDGGDRSLARSPWNAALATLLVGGIITLIWRGEEVPDAVLDERPAAVPSAPAAAPPASSSQASLPMPKPGQTPVQVPAPVPTPATAPGAAKAPSSLKREAPAREKRGLPPGGAINADKSLNDLASAPQELRSQGMAAAPAPASAPGAAGPAGSIAERIARNDSNNRSRAALFPPGALQTGDWVAADVLYQGRITRLARLDAQNLVNLALGLMAASPAASSSARTEDKATAKAAETTAETAVAKSDAEGGALTLRLQLVDQNSPAGPVAQLELRGTALRLQRKGQADLLAVLTPEAAAGLLAEAARALPR